MRTLQNADAYWRGEFAERWGGLTELQGEAAKLAGSWKNLYASRAGTDRTHAPWQKPSPFEVQVAGEGHCVMSLWSSCWGKGGCAWRSLGRQLL